MSKKALAEEQKVAQQETQIILDELRAPLTVGTDKFLINVNGAQSKIKTNKNGQIKYTLEQPIKLEIGDRITLLSSFVEEQGVSVDTISIEKDIEEEMRFMYYKQGNCGNIRSDAGQEPFGIRAADQQFAQFPNLFPDFFNVYEKFKDKTPPDGIGIPKGYLFLEGAQSSGQIEKAHLFNSPNFLGQNVANYYYFADTEDQYKECFPMISHSASGANGQYFYLMENYNPNGNIEKGTGDENRKWVYEVKNPTDPNTKYVEFENASLRFFDKHQSNSDYFRPLYGRAVIKVPAGNYSVSALSALISDQLNGTISKTNRFNTDALTDALYFDTDASSFTNPSPYLVPLGGQLDYEGKISAEKYNPDVAIIGEDYPHQSFNRRIGGLMTNLNMPNDVTANMINCETLTTVAGTTAGVGQALWFRGRGSSIPLPSELRGVNKDLGYITPTKDPILNSVGLIVDSTFKNQTNLSNSPAHAAREFNGNFYMALGGVRTLMESGYYYPTTDDLPHISTIPTLRDIFLCNLGNKGLKYYNQLVGDQNPHYPWGDGSSNPNNVFTTLISELQFSCMFPVISSGVGSIPQHVPPDEGIPPISGTFQQMAGTSAFKMDYSVTSLNRFSISNLHEPYKMASVTPDGKTNTNMGGQQATLFNSIVSFNFIAPKTATDPGKSVKPCPLRAGTYPIDSSSGVAVSNFSFGTVKDTPVYKNLVSKIEQFNTSNAAAQCRREALIYELFTKPFDDFFDNDVEASAAWDNTLWKRLGFTYNQIGKVSDKLETIFSYTNQEESGLYAGDEAGIPTSNAIKVKQLGIITHNETQNTFVPGSSGLGLGNFYDKTGGGANGQDYSARGYTCAVNETDTADPIPVPGGNDNWGVAQNYIHVLADSKAIQAEDFPSLVGDNNYLIIESDIVKTNAKDSKSNSATIVGIMSKENQGSDTIYSVEPITFTCTEPRLLSTIEVKIKNPDGSLVSDSIIGKNNGFIFQVEKAIPAAEIPLQGF